MQNHFTAEWIFANTLRVPILHYSYGARCGPATVVHQNTIGYANEIDAGDAAASTGGRARPPSGQARIPAEATQIPDATHAVLAVRGKLTNKADTLAQTLDWHTDAYLSVYFRSK